MNTTMGRLRSLAIVVTVLVLASVPATGRGAEEPFQVHIAVDAGRPLGKWKPIWRFFGADEPNYATMKDGRTLLRSLGTLGAPQVYFRTHNLLNTGDGTPAFKWGSTDAYGEDPQGRPVYNWAGVDRIFRAYLEHGIRPHVQIGFMPEALSRKPKPYQHQWRPGFPYKEIFTGWAYPPKDYAKWGELAYQWAKHCVQAFGRAEVEKWYWETWNEPNIPYGQGTPEEFYKVHDYAIAGVRRALPSARVGGPDAAGGGGPWMRDFLEHSLRMFGRMEGDRVAVESSSAVPLEAMLEEGVRGAPDVSALAAREARRLAILVWHYHDDDVPGPDAAVEMAVKGLPVATGEVRMTHYRIDDRHSNAYAEWKRMGAPLAPGRPQYDRLRAAGQLATLDGGAAGLAVREGVGTLSFQLPRQAVSLLVLEWP